MSTPVSCQTCGQQQELPEGYARPKFRCQACGSMNETPPAILKPRREKQAAAAAPAIFDLFGAEPVPTAAKPAADTPAKTPGEQEILLHGSVNEEDHNPYSVRGDVLTRTCSECGKALHDGPTICKHCGAD